MSKIPQGEKSKHFFEIDEVCRSSEWIVGQMKEAGVRPGTAEEFVEFRKKEGEGMLLRQPVVCFGGGDFAIFIAPEARDYSWAKEGDSWNPRLKYFVMSLG